VIEISREAYARMVGLALDEYPLEACGLLAGPPTSDGGAGDRAVTFYPCTNTSESARVYTVDPRDHLQAEDDADDHGWEINGVVHSHTHSEPYPSPTDVDAAVDPSWHYVIIGLKREAPEVRSYRIANGQIHSEPVAVI
jgi:proteasome lid subunit RPN8/RPN11